MAASSRVSLNTTLFFAVYWIVYKEFIMSLYAKKLSIGSIPQWERPESSWSRNCCRSRSERSEICSLRAHTLRGQVWRVPLSFPGQNTTFQSSLRFHNEKVAVERNSINDISPKMSQSLQSRELVPNWDQLDSWLRRPVGSCEPGHWVLWAQPYRNIEPIHVCPERLREGLMEDPTWKGKCGLPEIGLALG